MGDDGAVHVVENGQAERRQVATIPRFGRCCHTREGNANVRGTQFRVAFAVAGSMKESQRENILKITSVVAINVHIACSCGQTERYGIVWYSSVRWMSCDISNDPMNSDLRRDARHKISDTVAPLCYAVQACAVLVVQGLASGRMVCVWHGMVVPPYRRRNNSTDSTRHTSRLAVSIRNNSTSESLQHCAMKILSNTTVRRGPSTVYLKGRTRSGTMSRRNSRRMPSQFTRQEYNQRTIMVGFGDCRHCCTKSGGRDANQSSL